MQTCGDVSKIPVDNEIHVQQTAGYAVWGVTERVSGGDAISRSEGDEYGTSLPGPTAGHTNDTAA